MFRKALDPRWWDSSDLSSLVLSQTVATTLKLPRAAKGQQPRCAQELEQASYVSVQDSLCLIPDRHSVRYKIFQP